MSNSTMTQVKKSVTPVSAPAHSPVLANRQSTHKRVNDAPVGTGAGHDFGQVSVQAPVMEGCPLRLSSPTHCPFGGACHTCPVSIQTKLTIGQPGDVYEQEADRVAEQVMCMPEPRAQRQEEEPEEEEEEPVQTKLLADRITPLVQRQEEPEDEEEEEPIQPKLAGEVQRRCVGCEEEEEATVQTRSTGGHAAPGLAAQVGTLRQGGGQPLPEETRAFFEPRLGYDFSQVRVHANAQAAESSRALRAQAYTTGQDIVFAGGQYAPATKQGKWLVAHELTHVIQQTTGVAQPGQIQRLIRRTRVNCTAADGSFQNPYSADRRASALLTRAIERIDSALAERATDPTHEDVVAVGDALRTAFRLNPARESTWTQGAPQVRLPVIRRRLEMARDYIDSVVFRVDCPAVGGASTMSCGTCDTANEEAFVCGGEATNIALCPLFWTRNRNQQGRIIAHEVLHINFGFIEDWDQPDAHNAHCYAQFTALLNGFNSPSGYRCH